MAITPIQPNIDNTKSHRPYREAKGQVKTTNNVKPLPPEGHLVHDRLLAMPKFFIKDFVYDLNAVKDGFRGVSNDHQTGRLNDVGLKLGGIGIATMLAARTTNPLVRIMEYAGLGAFLASMTIFPKLAIQLPSRILHGFDSGKEYIDDQGRKKSVLQDPNYIPFDMYRGERKGEDLSIIADRLGIPRGIKNRDDLTKEQMRKIGIQNNTIWMLSAGFATPVITALFCYGMERLFAPPLEKYRNCRANSRISHILDRTSLKNMTLEPAEIDSNNLSKQVEKILINFKNKEIPQNELDSLTEMLTEKLDYNVSEGIKQDLDKIFKSERNGYSIGETQIDELINSIKKNIPANNRSTLERVFVPTKEELTKIIGSDIIKQEDLPKVKDQLKQLFNDKIEKETAVSKEFLKGYRNNVIENTSKFIQKYPSKFVSENNIKEVVDLAKILGEFKANDKLLDKCKSFKFEYAPETVLARSYGKFERTFLKELGFKFKDLKQMQESEQFSKEILDKKLNELVKNPEKYEKTVAKLSKIISEMEVALNGKSNEKSHILDLINAYENNYNNTAKRLAKAGNFKNTIDRLVKEDVSTLSNNVKSRQELFDLLDGTVKKTDEKGLDYAIENAKGVGSSKQMAITRIVERYQGAKNSFYRLFHTMDFYNREAPVSEYDKELVKRGKEVLLEATSSDHTLKINTADNPELYKDLFKKVWRVDEQANAGINDITKHKGYLTDSTLKNLGKSGDLATGDVAGRMERYINRFRDIIGNNNIDFTEPEHNLNPENLKQYSKSSKTRMQKFNLVSQTPVEFIQKAAERKYGTQKWFRIVSTIGASVIAATVAAQFAFGKIKNPQNIEKQVEDEQNS